MGQGFRTGSGIMGFANEVGLGQDLVLSPRIGMSTQYQAVISVPQNKKGRAIFFELFICLYLS